MKREKEVQDFFKEREQADRIIEEVRNLNDARAGGPSEIELADAVVNALMEKEEFWEKLSEVVAACLKDKKRARHA